MTCIVRSRTPRLAFRSIKGTIHGFIQRLYPQIPRRTFGKAIDTPFAKGFDEAETALADWMTYCDEVALYGPDDPLFSATAIAAKSNSGFEANGFTRGHWKSTEPVRKIVRLAFEAAGVPNYAPHAFRHMLARHAAKNATSVAELVAASQNLGHTDVLTTLRNYGQISREDQRKLVTGKTSDEN